MYQEQLTDEQVQAILEEQDASGQEEVELDYLTTKDVASHFGVQPSTVYQWIARGWLATTEAHMIHQRYRISISSFNDIDSRAQDMLPYLKKFIPRLLYGKG